MRNSIFALMGLLILSIILSGCTGDKVPVQQPDVEIIQLPPECKNKDNQTVNNCCVEECESYCTENNYYYYKHHPNRINCACWCAA